MKITYLANQKQTDGSMRLSVISHDEWLQIVGLNRNLPAEQKRYFITDVIQDMGERDYLGYSSDDTDESTESSTSLSDDSDSSSTDSSTDSESTADTY